MRIGSSGNIEIGIFTDPISGNIIYNIIREEFPSQAYTPQTNLKISKALKGIKRSKEFCQRNGEIKRGMNVSNETRQKQSKALKGRKFSNIHRKRISKSVKGRRNPSWKGGISFEPYCPKFNDEFKERVRRFWGYECGICGKSQKDNGIKLSVHHVNYEKMVCCDNTPPLFITTCKNCHTKTNWNRNHWENMLTEYIMIYFNGNSYNPK